MNALRRTSSLLTSLGGCLLISGTLCGCLQSTVGGQNLPSPTYLRDDIQYFPAGPEDKLANTRRALNEYRALQSGATDVYSPAAGAGTSPAAGAGAAPAGPPIPAPPAP